MFEIQGYKIKQYRHGYELHIPYDGEKRLENGVSEPLTKYNTTFYPSLILALTKIVDLEAGACEDAKSIISKIEESNALIMEVCNVQPV